MKKSFSIIGYIAIPIFVLSIVIFSCKKNSTTTTSTSTGSGCPTTKACGCSAKNKAECEAATDCCKWTVGSGCGCK